MQSNRKKRPKPGHFSRRLGQYSLYRTFQKDPLFAFAFAVAVIVGLAALIGVPRIWRSTPVGFQGAIIRVSLLDKFQAAALAREAVSAGRAGDHSGALTAWRAAISQNLGDARLHRGVLECLLDSPEPRREDMVIAAASTGWLLGLTHTNRSDLALVAMVLERHGHPRRALAMLAGTAVDGVNDEPIRRALARATLAAGDFDGFAEQWKRDASTWESDPSMRLRYDTWLAISNGSGAEEARNRLRSAMEGSDALSADAARLLHLAAQQRRDVNDLKSALARLDRTADRRLSCASDHAAYWLVLAEKGQEAEARRLAADYAPQTPDAESAATYVRTLAQLGLRTNALGFVSVNMGAFGHSPELWSAAFDLYLREQRWNDLQRAITTAKVLTTHHEPLYAEVLFAEYRSAVERHRPAEAETLARELVQAPLPLPRDAIRYGERLRRDGHLSEARQILSAHRAELETDARYWSLVFSTAMDARDLETMRTAVDGLLRLHPNSTSWENSRAALLLITGDEPAEALRLTFAGLQRSPSSPELMINHAFALVRNRRVTEARELLLGLDPSRLPPSVASSYRLVQVEIADAEGRAADVLAAAADLKPEQLLDPQRDRLNQMLARARSVPPKSSGL
ncbi:MAG: hypothetical protein JNK85_11790 [Verrucomicrobiales bacterium]|nr:hypothetical protein [Verrucomicrobiales bacterium]